MRCTNRVQVWERGMEFPNLNAEFGSTEPLDANNQIQEPDLDRTTRTPKRQRVGDHNDAIVLQGTVVHEVSAQFDPHGEVLRFATSCLFYATILNFQFDLQRTQSVG